jgi:hypothetical protein
MGEKRNVYRILVGKPERKRPLGRPKCNWVNNIKIDLKERENWVVWTGTVEDPCEYGSELLGSIKCWEVLEGLSDWQLIKKGSDSWGSWLVLHVSFNSFLLIYSPSNIR